MKRRDFIKVTGAGLVGIALGSATLPHMFRRSQALAANGGLSLDLEMVDVYHEMVDGQLIYSWAFSIGGEPCIPGPVIFATEGQQITLHISNNLDEPHSFAIKNNNFQPFVVNSGPIPPGATFPLSFTAPAPGTYIYQDLVNTPVGRVLGLHGILVSMPAKPFAAHDTPYGRLADTNRIQMLFDDLGGDFGGKPWFPGDCWRPERQIFWVFSELDPRYNKMAEQGQFIDPADMLQNYLPCYFFINGRTGYFAAFDHEHHYHHLTMMEAKPIPPADGFIPGQEFDTCLIAYQGEPILIRNVHVGLDTHSPHTHANHCYMLAHNGVILNDPRQGACWWVDTWTMLPEDRMDLIFPMIMPPDIPYAMPADLPTGVPQIGLPSDLADYDVWEKLKAGTSQAGFGPGEESHWNVAHPGPGFPMAWPMHSHQEISQTAAGGNYPQGLITHIEILGAFSMREQENHE